MKTLAELETAYHDAQQRVANAGIAVQVAEAHVDDEKRALEHAESALKKRVSSLLNLLGERFKV